MKTGLDTSVIIHILRKGSPQHEASWSRYLQQREAGAEFVITDQALLEAFSVLTRIPRPYRLEPEEAELGLKTHFGSATIAPTRTGAGWETIRHTISRGFSGGRIFDAVIALATLEAGARLLLTWNVRHFLRVAPAGLEIRQP
jgi:predicted nucleic acid-binding protein